VLVTSRNPAWQGVADLLAVDVLPLDEAAGLLTRRSGDHDERAAVALAGALGRLPLALEQAGAYTSQYGRTLAEYLELFDQRRAELLASGTPLAYQGTVDATFTLALDQLRVSAPAAVQLVELCALLAPDEIPLPLLPSQSEQLPEPLAAAIADPLGRGEVDGALYQTGLLTRDASDSVRVHQLVQAVTLAHLPESDHQQRTTEAVELLTALFPYEGNEPDQWPRCARLLAHVQAVLDPRPRPEAIQPSPCRLVNQNRHLPLGSRARRTARARAARAALAIRRQRFDGDHKSVADSFATLAVDLRELEGARGWMSRH
jgi:hypothetical protein